jgi:hypothetical protein
MMIIIYWAKSQIPYEETADAVLDTSKEDGVEVKVKVKLSRYLIKHHAMKTYGGVEI